MRWITLSLLLALTPAISGCAVAVAVPFVAGGAMATNDAISERNERRRAAEALAAEANAVAAQTEIANLTQPAADTEELKQSTAEKSASLGSVEFKSPIIGNTFQSLAQYASTSLADFKEGGTLSSAVLSNSASLNGERVMCDKDTFSVLIDLDPGTETFSDSASLPEPAPVAQILTQIRNSDISIAWISRNTAADADRVRQALIETGLDPEAQDQLLLMRYPDDRKQTRRAELAQETCLLAIVGDTHSDFDELYRYLINRDAAVKLESLIGRGWFLFAESASRIAPISTPTSPIEPIGEETEQ